MLKMSLIDLPKSVGILTVTCAVYSCMFSALVSDLLQCFVGLYSLCRFIASLEDSLSVVLFSVWVKVHDKFYFSSTSVADIYVTDQGCHSIVIKK